MMKRLCILLLLTGCVCKTPVETFDRFTKPYCVKGVIYNPQDCYDYKAVGYASWYGPGFHGKKTASGHVYNQYHLTGAHRTLPIPCICRVTNLRNGKSQLILITDRGPYTRDPYRIIDLSYQSAKKLGIINRGVEKVCVESCPSESHRFAQYVARSKHKNWPKLFEEIYC